MTWFQIITSFAGFSCMGIAFKMMWINSVIRTRAQLMLDIGNAIKGVIFALFAIAFFIVGK